MIGLKRIPLGVKIFVAVVILISFTSLVLTRFFILRQAQLYRETLEIKSVSLATNLAINAEIAVKSGDKVLLGAMLEQTQQEGNVFLSAVVDPKFKILGLRKQDVVDLRDVSRLISQHYFRPTKTSYYSKFFDETPLGKPVLMVLHPILSKDDVRQDEEDLLFFHGAMPEMVGEVVGYALVAVSTQSIEMAISANSQMSLLLTIGVLILAAILGYWFSHLIVRPIKALVLGTRRVSRGDFSRPVQVDAHDEIGDLATDFNAMVSKLFVQQTQLQDYSRTLEERVHKRTQELEHEKLKSDQLLRNILPETIAERLKSNEKTIADTFPEATVIFSDIVGFTALSARLSAQDLVNLLNQLFTEFDLLCEFYGIEKIKTIGDAYMAVAGVPDFRDDHAEIVAQMAIDMRNTTESFVAATGEKIDIRIGLHSGPVVAGVIGLKKFVYDLWGDTVNLASRMESSGEPGKIQLSEATRQLLLKNPRYLMTARGEIDIKGKGKMPTFWLDDVTPEKKPDA
ncbi:MAG: HAMP domain-containing protein [bacterium]|nr:HAMP domain-containing protein [bacterium]